jgi:fructokinase
MMFVVAGESLIDMVSEPRGADGVIHMHAHQGGSPYNCAIALAKLGNDSGFLCPISRDGMGDYLMEPLAEAGVTALLGERVREPTTLAVVTLNEKRQARYEFYRGAERALDRDKLIAALPERLDLYQTGGFCPIVPEDAGIWLDVIAAARARGAIISIDPNVRPSLVDDFAGYKQRLGRFLDLAHIIKVSDEDLEALDPALSIEAHAAAFLARPSCELVVVTLGEKGSLAFTAAGRGKADIWSPPVFGDTVGAGDSLMAGILSILAERGDLQPGRLAALDANALDEVLRFGAIVAGLNCGQVGCKPPTRAEVDAVLARG